MDQLGTFVVYAAIDVQFKCRNVIDVISPSVWYFRLALQLRIDSDSGMSLKRSHFLNLPREFKQHSNLVLLLPLFRRSIHSLLMVFGLSGCLHLECTQARPLFHPHPGHWISPPDGPTRFSQVPVQHTRSRAATLGPGIRLNVGLTVH